MGKAASFFHLPITCFFAPSFRAGLALGVCLRGRKRWREQAGGEGQPIRSGPLLFRHHVESIILRASISVSASHCGDCRSAAESYDEQNEEHCIAATRTRRSFRLRRASASCRVESRIRLD